jgi:hypothetical protein
MGEFPSAKSYLNIRADYTSDVREPKILYNDMTRVMVRSFVNKIVCLNFMRSDYLLEIA